MTQTRQTETKAYIKEALTQLLAEQSFEQLTISQLCQKAGLNRSTFYLHYRDKYDLLESLKEEYLSQLETLLHLNQEPEQAINSMLEQLNSDLSFISAIAQVERVQFSQTIKEFIFRLLIHQTNWKELLSRAYQIPYSYALEVYLASLESLVRHWIETGAKENPEEMTKILLRVAQIAP